MIKHIDAGYCILNERPSDKSYCECYKYPVPYTLFGHHGVLMMCRGWVDYMIAYSDWYERQRIICDVLSEAILKAEPQYDVQDVWIGQFGGGREGALNTINLYVTPKPFELRVSCKPSWFLQNVRPPGYRLEDHAWKEWRPNDIPPVLYGKLKHNMIALLRQNLDLLEAYIESYGNWGGKRIKKYDQLFSELNRKLKEYGNPVEETR